MFKKIDYKSGSIYTFDNIFTKLCAISLLRVFLYTFSTAHIIRPILLRALPQYISQNITYLSILYSYIHSNNVIFLSISKRRRIARCIILRSQPAAFPDYNRRRRRGQVIARGDAAPPVSFAAGAAHTPLSPAMVE